MSDKKNTQLAPMEDWKEQGDTSLYQMFSKPIPTGGTKHDSGKIDLSIIPQVALEHESRALMFGEKKYGRYNYTAGFQTSRLIAAALRHIHAYNNGEQVDSESGYHHLGHAKACLSMLLHCEELGTLTDNRFKKG